MTTQQESTQEKSLKIKEVADRFYELAKEARFDLIQAELFSSDARSIEPDSSPFPLTEGLDNIIEKAKQWQEMTEANHGGYCDEPIIAGNFFACTMGMDITLKGQERSMMDEIAVYEVKDGKIVLEQFFY